MVLTSFNKTYNYPTTEPLKPWTRFLCLQFTKSIHPFTAEAANFAYLTNLTFIYELGGDGQ